MAVLNQRKINFCMRVERSGQAGFACVREFLHSGLAEQIVTLRPCERLDAADYECCVFRTNVTDRFGIVTAEFGIVTDRFGDVTDGGSEPT